MKKILVLIICACFVACSKPITISLNGRIVSIKEYVRGADIIVFKADNTENADAFEIEADDEAMDKYYFLTKQHVRISLKTDKEMSYFENTGIEPIK